MKIIASWRIGLLRLGDTALDLGHLKHREMPGLQIMGMGTDGESYRLSNFMEHGTLSVRIRQDDYRSFLLLLYALTCFAADSGSRYSPEDAYIPGSYAGEGNPYGWSAVINSTLQPALGLRRLLILRESSGRVSPAEGGSQALVCSRPANIG